MIGLGPGNQSNGVEAPAGGLEIGSIISFEDDVYVYETSLRGEGGRYHAMNGKIMSGGEMGDKNYKFLSKIPAGGKFRLVAKFTERVGFEKFPYLLITPFEGEYSEIRFKYLLGATGSFPVLHK